MHRWELRLAERHLARSCPDNAVNCGQAVMKNVPMLSDHIRRPAADKFHDECAVVGVYGHKEAANLVYLGLYALQHRGQESSGIVASDGKGLISHRQMGLVADVFKEDVIKRLEG